MEFSNMIMAITASYVNVHWLDWLIISGFAIGLIAVAIYAKTYTRGGIADFLVGNRCAGRYLLSVATAASGVGAISIIAIFQMYYNGGFSAQWWNSMLSMPISMFIAISGWVLYRYRESRSMTMAQMFEYRYSRNFRIFCGILAWTTGVINMGIFPAVTTKFFIHFLGLPPVLNFCGLEISTFVTLMIVELSVALLLIILGGMVVVLITDFIQGLFCSIAFGIILVIVLGKFGWGQIAETLQSAPVNASMINPFKSQNVEGFNITFFMIMAFINFYGYMAWQGRQGYNAAAKNAHEAKMASIISTWRSLILDVSMIMLPVCAYTFMHHKDFANQAQLVNESLNAINNSVIRSQMTVPMVLAHILPIGVFGLFVAVMLAAAIATDDTYLHSWGCIFIQDVILPFRKSGFAPKQHLLLLRLSMVLVAIIIFCFSLFFRQTDYILMFFAITGSIYIGGAGAAVIGGLYWKRGTTKGAWAAMISGIFLACCGLMLQQTWSHITPTLIRWFPHWQFLANHNETFPLNGMQISFVVSLSSITAYIVFSIWDWLIQGKMEFNMDRLLHRGKYAIRNEHAENVALPPTGIRALLPSKEFTGVDKLLYFALITWVFGWISVFITAVIYHLIWGIPDAWWLTFWRFNIWMTLVLGIGSTIWFLIGGSIDLRNLLNTLKTTVRDKSDDGHIMANDNKSSSHLMSAESETACSKESSRTFE